MKRSFAAAALLALAISAAAAENPAIEQAAALLVANQPEKAADLLEKAVAAHPNDALLHYWLGSAYGREAQSASMFKQISLAGDCRKEFERAVQLDPNLIPARLGLVEFYVMAPGMMGGDVAKARQQATEIRKRDAIDGHRAFAAIASHEKNKDAARAEYAAAVKEQPNSPRSHYWYGVFLLVSDKNYKAAMDEFDAALRLDASYAPAMFQVGHTAALAGTDYARGEQLLLKYAATKPGPEDPPLARAHYWLGTIYEKQGKKAEAKAQFQTALKLQPGQKDAQEALARTMKAGRER